MQIVDIKNDLAKIVYTPLSRELFLADFLIVSDNNQNLLAQVINIESTQKNNANAALIKFILTVDKEGVINPYNGYVPARDSQVSYMEPEEVVELLKMSSETIPWGALASHESAYVSLDLELLKNKPYIQCETIDNNIDVVSNIISGLQKNGKKVAVIDFNRMYDSLNIPTYSITKDFKLPLDYNAFDHIYENDLEGMDLRSRAIIQDILLDLQKYSKEIKDGFISFDAFLNVINAQYKVDPSEGIILIRNKIVKYAQQKIFAQTKQDFTVLPEFFKNENVIRFDISPIPDNWQKIALSFILSQLKNECFVILNLTETNSDKKVISKLYDVERTFYPIPISAYSYPEAQLLKGIANNLILFTPVEKINDFAGYNTLLQKLNSNEFIIWGKETLSIPLIVKLSLFKTSYTSNKTQTEIAKSVDDIFRGKISQDKPVDASNVIIEEEVEPNGETKLIDEIPSLSENVNNSGEALLGEQFEIREDDDINRYGDILNQNAPNNNAVFNTSGSIGNIQQIPLVEPPKVDYEPDEVIVEDLPDLVTQEQPVKQFTNNVTNTAEIDYEAMLSDDDLDFIDELNEEAEDVDVPIFDAEVENVHKDIELLPPELCKAGTFVIHPKYGKGMIEKVINYGNKTLCSILFDNVGRRLLDPNLAELKEA